MSLHVLAVTHSPGHMQDMVLNFVHLSCPNCGMPSAAGLTDQTSDSSVLTQDLRSHLSTINRMGWQVVRTWPEAPKPRIPDHLPEPVAKAFLSAERNFAQKAMEEASAGSYGRALDVGTKLYAPDLAGVTLYNRIKKLAEQHRITTDLAAWAHAIRLIRNDALHEIDSVSRDELVAIRGFTETVLTYLFTLPGMLKARQALTGEKP